MLVLQAGPPEGKTHHTRVQPARSRESTALRICKVRELQRMGCKFSLRSCMCCLLQEETSS